jgi:hypothetical protein
MTNNSNPAGNPRVRPADGPRIKRPLPGVAGKQVPGHTESAFMRDLAKVTRRVPPSS